MKKNFSNQNLLNSAVLVLNANYSPMTVCTAKRAITLYFLDKIDVLSNYNDKVHSPTVSLELPSVIKIKTYIKNNSMSVEISRKNILVRDNYTCQYCETYSNALTVDHIIPKFRGGEDIWENLVGACKNCNQKKGTRTPEEAGMPLIKKPKRPNRIHYFQRYVKTKQTDWRPYLFMEPLV
jgi:5-methylcytosine-specific restriction endonuclease McrA|tara:strand:+ start:879 stop:1418 length:540 start_codon:yes stop_codon:yes gene_type:complete